MLRFTPLLRWPCLVIFLAAMTSVSRADNWERFLGPNGSGVSNDKNIPVQFSAKENVLWKTRIPGIGHSCPVVWGNRIFLQSASNDARERWIICLDTAGTELWKRSIPGVKAPIHAMSSLASATPTTDGESVYVSFWNGKDIIVAAYSVKGDRLWDRNLGPFVSQHGAGMSPILYKDKVIFANDMDALENKSKKPVPNPSKLYALNKKTGTTAWEAPREAYRACYSAPFVLEKPGTAPELIVTSTTAITSYDPDSGKPNWNWKWSFAGMPLRTVSSTAFVDGTLLACSGDGSGDRHMVAVAMNGFGKEARPDKLWENKKEFPYVGCLVTRGDYVYFTNDSGYAACFHAKTGKKMWYQRQADAKFSASPIMIDGKIYACSEQGDVYVFAAEPTYQLIAKNSLRELIRATPAVADGRLYIRGRDHLFCIGNK
jgi:outer membrane protein assembly factor BamB